MDSETRSSLRDFLEKKISVPITFFILLVAFFKDFQTWSRDPQMLPFVSLAGFITYLAVTLWFVFKAENVKQVWRWIALAALYIITILYSLWVGRSIIGPGSLGLVTPPPRSALAASNLVKYFGFETSASGWEDIVRCDARWENCQTIENAARLLSNQRKGAVAYVLELNAGGWLNYIVEYADPVRADVIVAHFYLPDTPDIEAEWVGIVAVDGAGGPWLARSSDSIPLGKWTQIVLDLRGKYDSNDVPLNDRAIFIQALYGVKGSATLQSDTFLVRLDDVAWYKPAGFQPSQEQRGAGRILFDFENESIEGWQIASGRVQTDTLTLSSEQVYRGQWALRLETQLEGRGSPPQRGWIAQVYLPADVPAGTSVWANLFTYPKSDYQDSASRRLERGMWNTLVWDTRDVDWGIKKRITIGIQIGAEGGSYRGPIYIDDIQLFEN
jgi:hypothetical protein